MIKPSRTSFGEPDAELEPLVGSLKRFLGALSAGTMAVTLRLDLTMPQLRAFHTIGRLGQVSGRQLARELGVSPAAVVPLCDRLEAQGYIRRIADTADRRITWLQLSSAGSGLFEEMASVRRSRIGPAMARLSSADRKTLTRLLDELVTGLEPAGRETAKRIAPSGPVLPRRR
jgi:DNA-binding MarR family transcriptional regulator